MPEGATDPSQVSEQGWRELPLWMWEVHNHVSSRIVQVRAAQDPARRTDDPIIGLWPTVDQCLTCYREDGHWDRSGLYAYLRLTYWAGPASAPGGGGGGGDAAALGELEMGGSLGGICAAASLAALAAFALKRGRWRRARTPKASGGRAPFGPVGRGKDA